jgi:F420-non-reducing hydrogenase large subunit
MSVKKAAMALIKPGKEITEGLLNRIEMAWRPYDLCLACASHTLPGQTPMEIIIRDSQGNEIQRLSRNLPEFKELS